MLFFPARPFRRYHVPRPPRPRSDYGYFNPDEFSRLLLEYRSSGDELVLGRLMRDFLAPLARGVFTRFRYSLLDREEAVGVVVNHLALNVLHQLDLERPSKAFCYLTRASHRKYLDQWDRARRYRRGDEMIIALCNARAKRGYTMRLPELHEPVEVEAAAGA